MAGPIPTKTIPQLTDYGVPLNGNELLEIWSVGTSRRVSSRAFVLPIDSVLTLTGMGATLPGSRQVIEGVGIAFIDGGAGSTLSINATGAVAGGANPTAQVGLTPVNGIAITYMRSDAAPALDTSISPTWLGVHTFAQPVTVSQGSPAYRLNEADAAVDNRLWDQIAIGEQLHLRAVNDAITVASSWVTVDRTGTTIDTVNLQATTVQVNGVNVRDAAILTSGLVGTARLGGGVADATTWLRGDQTWQVLPGSFTGFANPTATLGLAAVNGAATTAMRSDAAPALSQAIAPTWTAQHIFSLSGATNAAILVSSAQPQTDYNESDAAANNRRWRWEAQGEQFLGRTVNDANSAAVTWLAVDRTLNVVDTIALTSTALTWNGSPLLSAATAFANPTASLGLAAVNGAATTAMRSDAAPALSQAIAPTWSAQHIFSQAATGTIGTPAILVSSATPAVVWNETDAAVDNRAWYIAAGSEQLLMGVRNDAASTAVDFLRVDRTGTAVDTVTFPTTTAASFLVGTSSALIGSVVAHFLAPASTNALLAKSVTATAGCMVAWNGTTAGDGVFLEFGTEAAYTPRGSISYNRGAGLTAYNTTSDARRKKNIRDAPEASSVIDSIRVRSFEWVDTDNHLDHWIVAQELHAVCPYAVTQGTVTSDWAVDTSKLVPLLVKEIQSMRRRLVDLETPGNSNRNN